jgi:CheY-like chemotaxis protein
MLREGARVELATTGREAIERIKTSPFDVIVSDIAMPQMTGIELLETVRAHDMNVPVILMTGAPSLERPCAR